MRENWRDDTKKKPANDNVNKHYANDIMSQRCIDNTGWKERIVRSNQIYLTTQCVILYLLFK